MACFDTASDDKTDNNACHGMEQQEGGESPQDTGKAICQSKKSLLYFNIYLCHFMVKWIVNGLHL